MARPGQAIQRFPEDGTCDFLRAAPAAGLAGARAEPSVEALVEVREAVVAHREGYVEDARIRALEEDAAPLDADLVDVLDD
jgi:hypothetical protein